MPLESLSNEQINIHDLTLEQEKKLTSESSQKYENIKDSALYDEEKFQWNTDLGQSAVRQAHVQLIGVLVESLFDKKNAEHVYSLLKDSTFFDQVKNKWFFSINGYQEALGRTIYTEAQLYDVLCTSLINKNQAFGKYQILQNDFYDKDAELWKVTDANPDAVTSVSFPTYDQLIAILCEAQFDINSAREKYQTLKSRDFKNSRLFDQDAKFTFWGQGVSSNLTVLTAERQTKTELLGVLCESMFDLNEAKIMYDKLKDSQLYDKAGERWFVKYNVDNSVYKGRVPSELQLLDILCSQRFEEEQNFQSSTPKLPETRSY